MRILMSIFLSFLMTSLVFSNQENFRDRKIKAVKTEHAPKIDGKLIDSCWKDTPKAKPFIDSYTSKPAKDQTVAYVLYDEKAIYVAFKCFDSHPDQIIATETKRDGRPTDDDFVETAIDPYDLGRFEGRNVFKVNAIGTQFTEIRGGRAEKTEWKGDWEAAVSRTDFGWTAEMAIPWDIMEHPSSSKPITIGINFARHQARTGVFSFWSDLGHPFHHEWNGHFVGVRLPKSKRKRLRVLGYAFGGTEPEQKNTARLGLNLRYQPTPQINLLTTVNPDFSNIEQEVETIDFSYFPRAYSDRRPFFQEGSEILGGNRGVFYSRNIKEIDSGLKLYGRFGGTSFGMMDCADVSSWNALVFSGKQEIGETSSLGGYFVRSDDKDSFYNQVISLSGDGRFGKVDIGGFFNGSQTSGEGDEGSRGGASLFWRGKKVWAAVFGSYISPGYNPSLGFLPYDPFKGMEFNVNYTEERLGGGNNSLQIGVHANKYNRYEGGDYMSGISPWVNFNFKRGTYSSYWGGFSFDSSRYEEFKDNYAKMNIGLSQRYQKLLEVSLSLNFSSGRRKDFSYRYLKPEVKITLGENRFLVKYYSEFLWHKETRRQHVVWLNFNITPERSLGGRMVMNGEKRNWYLSYRQGVRKGIDAYFILGDPNAEEFQKRALVKLIVPLW